MLPHMHNALAAVNRAWIVDKYARCRECLWVLTGEEGVGFTLETLTSDSLTSGSLTSGSPLVRSNTRIQLTLTRTALKVPVSDLQPLYR